MKQLLIVPGLPRCATTSLVNMLMQHPETFRSRVKEPHTLIPQQRRDRLFGFVSGERKPFSKLGFIDSLSDYRRNFGDISSPGLYIDASTLYSVHLGFIDSLKDLAQDFDAIKFIVLTRDPYKRALSHYRFSVSRGEEHRSFREAIEAEFAPGNDLQDWILGGYVKGSSPDNLIRAIQANFPAAALMTIDIDSTDLYARETQERLCRFLEISPHEFSQDVYENKSEMYASPLAIRARILMKRIRDLNPMFFDNRVSRFGFRLAMSLLGRSRKQPLQDNAQDRALFDEKYRALTSGNGASPTSRI